MVVTSDGQVFGNDEAVVVDSMLQLDECFVVRVLRRRGCSAAKELAAEFEFDEFPTPAQIMYCIAKGCGDMADVRKRYFTVKNGEKYNDH